MKRYAYIMYLDSWHVWDNKFGTFYGEFRFLEYEECKNIADYLNDELNKLDIKNEK